MEFFKTTDFEQVDIKVFKKGKTEHINIQGCINARMVRAYNTSKDACVAYANTLTDEQKSHARNHLKIVLDLAKQKIVCKPV
jgi:hypothetical protein